jgi:hypothetical protein
MDQMMDLGLGTWANIAEIIGAGSIIIGFAFGWIQIRHLRNQQRDAVAINLAQTFYNKDLAEAIAIVQSVPDGISLKEMRDLGQEYQLAAITVVTSFETMGLLIFKRVAPMDLVMDLAGGIVSVMCKKLRRWQDDLREEQQQPSWGEWFEWLGDQALAIKQNVEPAHIRHRNWKP